MGYVEILCIKEKGTRIIFCTTQVTKLNNFLHQSGNKQISTYPRYLVTGCCICPQRSRHKKWNWLHKAMQIGNGKFQPSTNYGNGTQQAI
jgi:hypothetical protein